jgi:hypothetical protein
MNINKLQRATEILASVKLLDEQILEIGKIANALASNNHEVHLNLKCKNLDKSGKDKVSFDKDGSLVYGDCSSDHSTRSPFTVFFTMGEPQKPKPKFDHEFNMTLSDSNGLGLLGVLVEVKQMERDALLKRLAKLGVEL